MRNNVRATSAVNDRLRRPSGPVFSEAMSSLYSASLCSNARQKVINKTTPGADLGFYKGGCPIHLKGAPEVERPPPNYFDPCYRNQTIFLALEKIVGARRSYDIQSYVKSLTKFLVVPASCLRSTLSAKNRND